MSGFSALHRPCPGVLNSSIATWFGGVVWVFAVGGVSDLLHGQAPDENRGETGRQTGALRGVLPAACTAPRGHGHAEGSAFPRDLDRFVRPRYRQTRTLEWALRGIFRG